MLTCAENLTFGVSEAGMSWLRCFVAIVFSIVNINGQASVLTWHNDNARTGQNLQETTLAPSNVNPQTFGRVAFLNVDGKVDAQPLFVPSVIIPGQGVHNVLYVGTEHGTLYAFDADTFAQLLRVSLIGANETPSDDHGCGQITPEIGITSTPAIDLQVGSSGMIYVITQSRDLNQTYHHRLHAIDLATFAEQLGGPIEIQASFPGNGVENTFAPEVHAARPGLLISNGVIYTTWGSHCDHGFYAGWVISYSKATLAQIGVLNLVPNGSDAGIWAAGAGPAADAGGNIFLSTGNGTFDATLNSSSFPSMGDFGNAFVKLSTLGPLSVSDYFTMRNTVFESRADVDLGSGGVMLLPPMDNGRGTGTSISLLVGAGKDTNVYVLDQSNLGKFNPTMDSIYQLMPGALPGGAWSSPAWFNGNLYYAGVGDRLKAFAFQDGSFTLSSSSSNSFVYPGATPAISANGNSNGIVWTVENQIPAILHAYDANNVATELYNSNQAASGRDHFGSGNKFIVPTIANGRVYVGTANGVAVFGLLAGNPPASLNISKTHLGNFAQGGLASYVVQVSNPTSSPTAGPVTVTEMPSQGLTVAGMAGLGWTCTLNTKTCVRSDVLAGRSSFPAIAVTMNVAPNAGSPQLNTVHISGGGLADATVGDSAVITPGGSLPGTPVLVSPGNGAHGASTNPTLTWNAASGATSYDIYFGTFPIPSKVATTASLSYSPPILDDNTTYYWQIVARNNAGVRGSSIFSFVTAVIQTIRGPASVGAFREGQWALAAGTFNFGLPGDVPVVGDWSGNGTLKIGVFRPSTQMWYLDLNGDGFFQADVDLSGQFGLPGDVPVVGDWDSSGRTKIGVFRPSSALWVLDLNGNMKWDGGDVYGVFGLPGDTPVVGDWTGSGTTKVGVFRSSNAIWALDINGDLGWGPPDIWGSFGFPGDTPVVGDWDGSGKTKIGIFRQSNAVWAIDKNGNLAWDASDAWGSFGFPGDLPVTGDWTATGRTRIGIYRPGSAVWALDIDGGLTWSATDTFGVRGPISGTAVVVR